MIKSYSKPPPGAQRQWSRASPSFSFHLNLMAAGTWLKTTFTEADKNGDGTLSISEVLQLLHKLNVNLPRQKVKQMFKVTAVKDSPQMS